MVFETASLVIRPHRTFPNHDGAIIFSGRGDCDHESRRYLRFKRNAKHDDF